MLTKLLKTNDSWSPTIIRTVLAIVLFPHGAQKLLGWFGGYGFAGTMGYFTESIGLPWIIGFVVIMIEFFIPFLLLSGLLTRISAVSIFGLFTCIILTSHLQNGFFMNWYGQMDTGQEGFEFHLLVLGMAVALMISGAGKYALDSYLCDTIKTN